MATRWNREEIWAVGALGAWLAVTAMWWVLAFAPLPIPDEALLQFREVCFGSAADGLPNAGGWMQLILGPAGALVFLLVVWHKALRSGVGRLAATLGGRILIGLIGVAVTAGMGAVLRQVVLVRAAAEAFDPTRAETGLPAELPANYPRVGTPLPPLKLVDQHGARVDAATLGATTTVLTFAYAHCQTVCPVIVQRTHQALERMGSEAPPLYVLTLDPWRDTPGALPGMLSGWKLDRDPAVRALSGSVDDVTAALAALQVPGERDPSSGEITHPALVYIIDAQGRIAYMLNNPPVEWIIEAVRRARRTEA